MPHDHRTNEYSSAVDPQARTQNANEGEEGWKLMRSSEGPARPVVETGERTARNTEVRASNRIP